MVGPNLYTGSLSPKRRAPHGSGGGSLATIPGRWRHDTSIGFTLSEGSNCREVWLQLMESPRSGSPAPEPERIAVGAGIVVISAGGEIWTGESVNFSGDVGNPVSDPLLISFVELPVFLQLHHLSKRSHKEPPVPEPERVA